MRVNFIYVVLFLITAIQPGLWAATISGKVTIDGVAPKGRVIDMSADPVCAKGYSQSDPPKSEATIAGPHNALENVVVYISAGANDEGTVPSEAVTLDQHGCRYIAHVTPLHVNQQLKVSNSDPTTHNVHAVGNDNQEWNRSQPPGSQPFTTEFQRAEFVPVKCNFHPWMQGYIAVLKTNHFAVTDSAGAFSLKDLSPGKYTITAWHEKLGTLEQEVTVGNTKETKAMIFKFKAKGN